MRRISIASACLSALVLFAPAPARADEPTFPKFADLPTGSITAPPRAGPRGSGVSSRESVPGFFFAAPKEMSSSGSHRVLVLGDARRAAKLDKGGGGFNTDEPASACFAADNRPRLQTRDDERPNDWDQGGIGSMATLWTKNADMPFSGVLPVHMERLRVAADGATANLEMVDAWVDPGSRGARLIDKATLPLKQIGLAPGGGKVFAGRVERADGRREVQFVIVRQQEALASQLGRSFARRLDGEIIQEAGCAHFRIGLPVTKEGDSALVTMTVVLPPLDGKETPTLAQLQGGSGGRVVRSKRTATLAFPPPPKGAPPFPTDPNGSNVANADEPDERELRLREAGVQLSVSQTSRDKEPVVSVSHRWLARERTQRVFVPRAATE